MHVKFTTTQHSGNTMIMGCLVFFSKTLGFISYLLSNFSIFSTLDCFYLSFAEILRAEGFGLLVVKIPTYT